jgi:outer membrane lipoprotein-sorting protein
MRLILPFFLLLSLLGSAFAQADRPVLARLQEMLSRQEAIRMSGVRVVSLRINGELRNVVELVIRDGKRSRTEFPNDPVRKGMIIIEDGSRRLEYIPHLNELRRSPSRRDQTLMQMQRLIAAARQGQVRIQMADGGRVADRPTVRFDLGDARGNLAQRLWFDRETGLLLKAQQLGRGGALMGGFEFRRVAYNPAITPDLFQFRREGVRIVDEAPGINVPWALRPTWLPQGFEPIGEGMRMAQGRRIALLHFTDGAHHITIFQSQGARLGDDVRGNARFNIVTKQVGDLSLAAVGDVSVDVLKKILDSMARMNPERDAVGAP